MSDLTMKPRERVLTAISHKEPDRVPICFGGTIGTGILECPPGHKNCTALYEYLGLTDYEEPAIGPVLNAVGNIDERVKVKFGSDLRYVAHGIPVDLVDEPDGKTKMWPSLCGSKIRTVGQHDEFVDPPMAKWTSKKDIENYPYWPDKMKIPIADSSTREEAKRLRETTDYAIVGDGFYLLFPFAGYPIFSGLAKWLIDMKIRPDFYHSLANRLLEVNYYMVDEFFKEVGDFIDLAHIGDDLGTQSGLFCRHSDFVEFIKPYTKKVIERIKKYTDAKIIMHSCGSVYDAIPDLIEIGVDVLHPVQPFAKNNEPWRLKKEFGKDITFCGGLDLQHILPVGGPKDVRERVKEMINYYAPGGGYIFSGTHNIPPDVPPENIVAAFKAAQEFGIYPIK